MCCYEHDLAPNGVFFREVKSIAMLQFSHFTISHCLRACNNVADALALFGSNMEHEPQAVWPGHVPAFAQCFVASDRANGMRFPVSKKKVSRNMESIGDALIKKVSWC